MIRTILVAILMTSTRFGPVSATSLASGPSTTPQGSDTGGVVVDSARHPILGASVTLLATEVTVTTGPNGRFAFRGVPRGQSVLSVRAIGYLPVLHDFDLGKAAGRGDTVMLRTAPVRLPSLNVNASLGGLRFDLAPTDGPGIFGSSPQFGISVVINGYEGLAVFGNGGRESFPRAIAWNPGGGPREVGQSWGPGVECPAEAGRVPLSERFLGRCRDQREANRPAGTSNRRDRLESLRESGGLDPGFDRVAARNRAANPSAEGVCPGATAAAIAGFVDSTTRRFTLLTNTGDVWATLVGPSGPGPCRLAQQLAFDGDALAAAGDRAGWVAVVRRPVGLVISRWRHSARVAFVAPVDSLFDRATDTVTVTAFDGRTLVARRQWPFGWVDLDSTGQVIRRTADDGGAAAQALLEPRSLSSWHAYQVVPTAAGFIQTLEDSTGSRRAYLLFDITGRLVKTPTGGASSPIFVASVRGARALVGLVGTRRRLYRGYRLQIFSY